MGAKMGAMGGKLNRKIVAQNFKTCFIDKLMNTIYYMGGTKIHNDKVPLHL